MFPFDDVIMVGDGVCYQTAPFSQTGAICLTTMMRHHPVSLATELLLQTHPSWANDKFHTTMIHPWLNTSVYFSLKFPVRYRLGLCSSGSSLVFSDVAHHPWANLKCIIEDIPFEFPSMKYVPLWHDQPHLQTCNNLICLTNSSNSYFFRLVQTLRPRKIYFLGIENIFLLKKYIFHPNWSKTKIIKLEMKLSKAKRNRLKPGYDIK